MIEILDQLPGEIAWKDKNFHYLGCNTNRANRLVLTHPQDIVGLSDRDLDDQTDQSIQFHREHDELALSGTTIKTLHPAAKSPDGITFFQVKKPFLEKGEISGVIYHCNEFFQLDLFKNLQIIDNTQFPSASVSGFYQIEPSQNYFCLTPRELECLFCLLRGMTAKMIAELIKLSKRTVESYIENIKNKLNCRTKTEVIIKAIEKKYIQFIPERFIYFDWNSFINTL